MKKFLKVQLLTFLHWLTHKQYYYATYDPAKQIESLQNHDKVVILMKKEGMSHDD
jgi:hypothetical protein